MENPTMKNTNFLVAHSTLTNTIYAGTMNDEKTEWVDKSDVTKEAIEAVRDYAVQKLVDKELWDYVEDLKTRRNYAGRLNVKSLKSNSSGMWNQFP